MRLINPALLQSMSMRQDYLGYIPNASNLALNSLLFGKEERSKAYLMADPRRQSQEEGGGGWEDEEDMLLQESGGATAQQGEGGGNGEAAQGTATAKIPPRFKRVVRGAGLL
jgi:hypothetical protein